MVWFMSISYHSAVSFFLFKLSSCIHFHFKGRETETEKTLPTTGLLILPP